MSGVKSAAWSAKRTWQGIMQGGSWIAAIAMTFLMSPPGHTAYPHGGPVSWTGLSRFVVATANVAAAVAATQYARPRFLKPWLMVAACSFCIGIFSLAAYAFLFGPWTCLNAVGTTVAVGDRLNPKLILKNLGSFSNDCDLLDRIGNDPLRVWVKERVFFHENILGMLFVLTISCLSLSIIALLQAHKLAMVPKRAKPETSLLREE